MLVTMLPSYAGDGAAVMTWLLRDLDIESCLRRCCRVLLVTVLPGPLGCGLM
jgi:hypothetical protein